MYSLSGLQTYAHGEQTAVGIDDLCFYVDGNSLTVRQAGRQF
jgi:hypothetical protein